MRCDFLDVRVVSDQVVVEGYGILVGEEGTYLVDGCVDGGVAFETGVVLSVGACGFDILFVACIWHPL